MAGRSTLLGKLVFIVWEDVEEDSGWSNNRWKRWCLHQEAGFLLDMTADHVVLARAIDFPDMNKKKVGSPCRFPRGLIRFGPVPLEVPDVPQKLWRKGEREG